MSHTRSYYTIEEPDGTSHQVETASTPVSTPREKRPASSFASSKSLDPDTGDGLDPQKLDRQLDALGVLEVMAKRGYNPWYLQHQLNELINDWDDKAPMEGLSLPRVANSTRDKANERRERIRELQQAISKGKIGWTLGITRKMQICECSLDYIMSLPCVRAIVKTNNGKLKVKVKTAPRSYEYAEEEDWIIQEDDGRWRIEKGGQP